MSERKVRQSISNITVPINQGTQLLQQTTKDTIFPTEEERKNANGMLRKVESKGAIERMIANDPEQVNWLYGIYSQTLNTVTITHRKIK